MTQALSKMTALYSQLLALGFPKAFVRSQALPDWWDCEFEATPGAEVEAAAYISRRLNLDIASLLKPDTIPTFKHSCQAKFKLKPGTKIEELKAAQCMAARVAEMVAYACTQECKVLPTSALLVRDEILKTVPPLVRTASGIRVEPATSFVNLEALLEFCWNYGIAVVYFDNFPPAKKVKRFDGMVAYFHNRPVIVLGIKQLSIARLLFVLAHELGHIIKGHLNSVSIAGKKSNPESTNITPIEAEFLINGEKSEPKNAHLSQIKAGVSIIDRESELEIASNAKIEVNDSIVDEQIELESEDAEEIEANEFAAELLLGKPNIVYYTPRNFTAEQLVSYAQKVSISDRVDPGIVALNYAWSKANRAVTNREQKIIWATAYKALKLMEGDADAPAQINRYLQKHLDLERLDADSQDYLELVTAG